MSENRKQWKPGRRDVFALLLVVVVIVILSLGTRERRTAATPDDKIHRTVSSHAECMRCHGPQGTRPQPSGHTREDQCFLCHRQPEGWKGTSR